VLRAIEKMKHLVLILSRRALESEWVKREWTHARMVGRKVSPVLADPTIRRSDLPGWIRRADVYDISDPERWTMLVRVLEGKARRCRLLAWNTRCRKASGYSTGQGGAPAPRARLSQSKTKRAGFYREITAALAVRRARAINSD
jgi:hypothetical protein